MKVLISAAEASSDTHAAHLLRELRAQSPTGQAVEAFGVGGPKLREAGLRTIVDARELLSMGFIEILGRLPRILRALNQIAEAAATERPDVVVVVDYPDFHFRLARRMKRLGIPVVYYIPPKVWAWRKKRIRDLRALFVKVLCVFPFERDFFIKAGLPIRYVGNPLLDELPLKMTRQEARVALGLGPHEKVLTLMPGSRPSELKWNLDAMLDASVRTAARLRKDGHLGAKEAMRVFIPLPATASLDALRSRVEAWQKAGIWDAASICNFKVSQGDSAQCLIASDVALIKSGTSTLEAAVLGCPHTVLYRGSIITYWIFKYLIRYRGPIALTNLVGGKKAGDRFIVKELIGPEASPQNLARETEQLFVDQKRREELRVEFNKIRASLVSDEGTSPSILAAREILSLVRT